MFDLFACNPSYHPSFDDGSPNPSLFSHHNQHYLTWFTIVFYLVILGGKIIPKTESIWQWNHSSENVMLMLYISPLRVLHFSVVFLRDFYHPTTSLVSLLDSPKGSLNKTFFINCYPYWCFSLPGGGEVEGTKFSNWYCSSFCMLTSFPPCNWYPRKPHFPHVSCHSKHSLWYRGRPSRTRFILSPGYPIRLGF